MIIYLYCICKGVKFHPFFEHSKLSCESPKTSFQVMQALLETLGFLSFSKLPRFEKMDTNRMCISVSIKCIHLDVESIFQVM